MGADRQKAGDSRQLSAKNYLQGCRQPTWWLGKRGVTACTWGKTRINITCVVGESPPTNLWLQDHGAVFNPLSNANEAEEEREKIVTTMPLS